MKNTVKQFLNDVFGEVRTIVKNDEIWFCASDIAKALGDREANRITRILDDEDRVTHIVGTAFGDKEMSFISESGLYEVILSKKPKSEEKKNHIKQFKKWITKEVIPTLRKDGMYVDGEENAKTSEELTQLVDEAMERKILRKYGIGVRKNLTGTIKENWTIKTPKQYGMYTNELVYKPLFNKTASQLKKDFDVKQLRDDLFSNNELSQIANVENDATTLIEFGADYYKVKEYIVNKYHN